LEDGDDDNGVGDDDDVGVDTSSGVQKSPVYVIDRL
jgi:hypothetical protein